MNRMSQMGSGALALALSMGFAADSAAQATPDGGTFTVTASVGSGEGDISPPSQTFASGDSAGFFVIAQPGWAVDAVTGDTCTPADNGDGTWTAPNITADCAVTADFAPEDSSVVEVCSSPQVALPDNSPAGIDDSLNISAIGVITAVRVRLEGQHTWVGDLIFDLTHPDGSPAVRLIDRPGVPASTFGCSNDNFDVWLEDGGADGPVEDQCAGSPPALFGNAIPEQALSAFDGLDTAGNWTLNASDNVGDYTGTLDTWCLELTYQPEVTPTFLVSPSAGPGGTIAPDTEQTVTEGETAQFELRPEEGFDIDGVGGSCGGSLSNDLFTTNPVLDDCTVEASFALREYTVNAQVGEGQGSVEPASQTIAHGQPATVTVSPDAGWRIEEVRGDTCTPVDDGGGQWTAPTITADCQITVDFELITFTVTPTTFGGGGSIAPATPQVVLPGTQVEFVLTPSETQEVDEVTGTCGGTLSDTTFTTSPVSADCTVEGRFRTATFTVTAVASGQGTIDPASQTIEYGESADFTVAAADDWALDGVSGDTCSPVNIGSNTWRAENITADCQVTAIFVLIEYSVGAQVGVGQGSVEPANQTVEQGQSATVTVSPDEGWRIDEVRGDTCTPVDDGGGQWTAPTITDDCQITVDFEQITLTVTAGATGQGTIDPASQTIAFGASADFTVAAADDWALDGVSGDTCSPVNIGSNTWRAENITADCQVTAVFRALDDAIFEDRFEASD